MTSGYEKSPDYGGPPIRPRDVIGMVLIATAVVLGLILLGR